MSHRAAAIRLIGTASEDARGEVAHMISFELFGAFVIGTLVGAMLAYLSWDAGDASEPTTH